MILVDTSVWIDYLRARAPVKMLSDLILQNQIICHEWIVGELIVGNLGPQRNRFLEHLNRFLFLPTYPIGNLVDFVNQDALYGKGLSLVDLQLLYSAIRTKSLIWTSDKALRGIAKKYDREFQYP